MRRPSRRRRPGELAVGRAGILRAALHVFEQVGFEAATVRSIAAQAGVSAAALYHHFAGKDELLVAVCELKVAVLKSSLEGLEPAGWTPASHARGVLEAALAWALQNLGVYELLLAGTGAQRSDKVWALGRDLEATCLRALEAALSESSPGDRSRIETGARALWATANGVLCLSHRQGCAGPIEALLFAAVEPVLREITTTEIGGPGPFHSSAAHGFGGA